MKLTPFDDAHLPELMRWFLDEVSCHTWGGTEFRFPFTEATFRQDAKLAGLSTWALVADDGTLAGFGQFYLRVGRCHLGRLAIAPDARGQGLGATLVRELCRQGGAALGVGSFSLFVVPGNERALRLYRWLGISPTPYPEPTPALDPYVYMVATPRAQVTLRKAARPDVNEIQRVRQAVRENRRVSTVITDEEVIAAIEQTGKGWVVTHDFLTPAENHTLARESRELWENGGFRRAGVGHGETLAASSGSRTSAAATGEEGPAAVRSRRRPGRPDGGRRRCRDPGSRPRPVSLAIWSTERVWR